MKSTLSYDYDLILCLSLSYSSFAANLMLYLCWSRFKQFKDICLQALNVLSIVFEVKSLEWKWKCLYSWIFSLRVIWYFFFFLQIWQTTESNFLFIARFWTLITNQTASICHIECCWMCSCEFKILYITFRSSHVFAFYLNFFQI